MPTFTPPFSSILRLAALFIFLLAFASTGWGQVIVGWDSTGRSTGSVWAGSLLTANTTNSNLTMTTQLTRGSSITASGSGVADAIGGSGGWSTTAGNATAWLFTFRANSGYQVSLSSLALQTRRSGSGPNGAKIDIAVGSGAFSHMGNITTSSTSGTGTLSTVTLSTCSTLQNVTAGQNITVRISANGTAGNWYMLGGANAIMLNGTVTPASSTAPSITSFSPTSGLVGDSITITGANFASNATVSFNGTLAAPPTVTGTTSIDVTVPSGATTGPITVTVGSESGTSSSSFTVNVPGAPALTTTGSFTAFSTTAGNASASQSISVNGTNLTASINATAPAGFEVSSDNSTYGSTATIAQSGGPLFARIASTATAGALTGNITLASTGATSVSLPVTGTVTAPVAYISLTSSAPASYSQDFDSLGSTTTNSVITSTPGQQTSLGASVNATLNGWYGTKLSGTGASATNLVADSGTSSSGALYSYGANASTDRALGALASGSNTLAFGALIKNDTGSSLVGVQVSLTAEFWRSSTSTANILTFAYGTVDGTTVTTSNFLTANASTALAELNINGPAPVSSNAALDGNDPANQSAISSITIPATLAPGAVLFIRWQDANETGNDAGLAIDNISITAASTATPSLILTGTLTAFSTPAGLPSATQSLTATGSNLSANATATAPDGFEISTDGTTFAPTATLAPAAGSLNATLTIRLASSSTPATLTGNLTLASTGATTRSTPLTGTIRPAAVTWPHTQDFETNSEPWFTHNSAGSKNWTRTSSTLGGGTANSTANFAMEMNGFGSDVPAEDWLLIGPFNFTTVPNPRILFNTLVRYTSSLTILGELALKVSTNYSGTGNPASATWTTLDFEKPTAELVKTSSGNVTLTGAGGQSGVYIAFHYTAGGTTSGSTALWQVDDVQIDQATIELAPVLPDATLSGTVGTPFSYSLNATNSPTSYGIAVGSSLPAGLTLDTTTGAITGTPTTAGTTNATLTATNSGGTGSGNLTFLITATPPSSGSFDSWTGGNVTMTPTLLQTYAIGGGSFDGTTPAEPIVFDAVSGGNLTLTAIVRTDDPALTVIGEHKTDLTLGTWTSLGNGTITANQTGVPTGCERRAFTTPADGTKKFLRLRAVYDAN